MPPYDPDTDPEKTGTMREASASEVHTLAREGRMKKPRFRSTDFYSLADIQWARQRRDGLARRLERMTLENAARRKQGESELHSEEEIADTRDQLAEASHALEMAMDVRRE